MINKVEELSEKMCMLEDFCSNLTDRVRSLEKKHSPFVWRAETAREIIEKQELDRKVYVKDVIEIVETLKKDNIEHPFAFSELCKILSLLEKL